MTTPVWRGLDAPRTEVARVELKADGLFAEGTQIGVSYEPRYELELEPGRLRAEVVGGATLETGLDRSRAVACASARARSSLTSTSTRAAS